MPFADPKKRKQYQKEWYERNKHTERASALRRANSARRQWAAYKEKHKCTYCGAQHRAIIDFHHVIKIDKKSVNRLVRSGGYEAAVREAEEKCIPLCSNCHRILHWDEHNERRKKRKKKASRGQKHE